jgi:predicted nucleic acid-binding protein
VVDASVWSLAMRRPRLQNGEDVALAVRELDELIREGRAVMLGPIRQELLSGHRLPERFERLRLALAVFPDEPLLREDYELAARNFNTCRAHGVQGSPADFLICAIAYRLQLPIFTTDLDFTGYARHLPVTLHSVRGELRQ